MYRDCYAVLKHTYGSKKDSSITSCHTDKQNALGAREDLAFGYIQEKDGQDKTDQSKYLFTDTDFFAKRDLLAHGHYATRNAKEDFYCLTVWRKYKETVVGMVYNTTVTKYERVFDVNIIRMPAELVPKFRCISYVDPYEPNKICLIDEEKLCKLNNKIKQSLAFKCIRRMADAESSKSASVLRLRYDFKLDFVKCPRAKDYEPIDVSPPSPEALAKAVRERHEEMQKKRDSESSE